MFERTNLSILQDFVPCPDLELKPDMFRCVWHGYAIYDSKNFTMKNINALSLKCLEIYKILNVVTFKKGSKKNDAIA